MPNALDREINQSAIKGEPHTGFEARGRNGPFECGNCSYFEVVAGDPIGGSGACDQKDMKAYSSQPRLADGRIKVGAKDCCEFVERVGG